MAMVGGGLFARYKYLCKNFNLKCRGSLYTKGGVICETLWYMLQRHLVHNACTIKIKHRCFIGEVLLQHQGGNDVLGLHH